MIQSLRLTNIRCFKNQKFEFAPGINLIIGPNGSGKTSILEGIAFFAFGRVLSVDCDFLVVSRGEEVGRLELEVKNEPHIRAEAAFLKEGKVIRFQDKKVPNSQIIGFVKAVLFNVETVDLVSGSPQTRRREVDLMIAQRQPAFVRTLLQFRRVLRQRNILLRDVVSGRAQRRELDFWNKEFVTHAEAVFAARLEFINFVNREIGQTYDFLTKKPGDLKLKYSSSAHYDRLEENLIGVLEEDLRYGLTTIGPHRDDIVFNNNGFSLRQGGSRGEQRLAAVAYKAEAKKFLAGENSPVLILDDVFSELDEEKREAVAEVLDLEDDGSQEGPAQEFQALAGGPARQFQALAGGQVFVSGTDERVIPPNLIRRANLIRL
jgi:DNA replication and repair protein RecF